MPLALKIVLLALVQGFTEFFPVSSSGHLLVFQKLLDFTTLPLVYDIFFHLGTLLAVVVYFFKDLKPLALRFYERENFRLLLLLADRFPAHRRSSASCSRIFSKPCSPKRPTSGSASCSPRPCCWPRDSCS